MKYPREEQETIIRKGALDDFWSVYTSDSTMMTKLDKLVEASDEWEEIGRSTCEGDIVSKDYECTKGMIMIASKSRKKPEMTPEEKAAYRMRFKPKNSLPE